MTTRSASQSVLSVMAKGLTRRPMYYILAALTFGLCMPDTWAETVVATPLAAISSPRLSRSNTLAIDPNGLKTTSKPSWQDLTSAQKASLSPLAANWNTLKESQKRKWIAVASNYPSLAPTEQIKLHNRMSEWVSLSQQQRTQARLNFAKSRQLDPTQKKATWQAYQALTPDEKRKLAITARSGPTRAAAATKSVSPQKLTAIPVTRHSPKQKPSIAAANTLLNRHTLLPRAPAPVASAPVEKNSTSTMSPE